MFTCKLEEDLSAIFQMPVNRDLGQSRNKCELYYRQVREIDISVSPGDHFLFNGEIMVEVEFDIDMECYGKLTADCHAYERMYERSSIKSSNKREIPINATESRIIIGKELTFAYKIDYDKVRETIKTIDWS